MTLCCLSAFAQDATEGPASGPQNARPALPAAKAAGNRLLDVAVAGSRLVAVGEQGVILLSEDTRQWRQVDAPVDVMLTRLRFADAQNGWVLGYDASILRSTDGGQSWTLQHRDPDGRALYDLMMLDAQNGIAVGAYGNYRVTVDGGQTWAQQDNALSALGLHFNALVRLGDGSILLTGERGLVARSVDAGANWQVLDFPYTGSLFGALPQGERGVLVYGMRGKLFDCADVGARTRPIASLDGWDAYARENLEEPEQIAALGWRRLPTPVQESLFGALPTAGGAVLVGVNGSVLRYDSTLTTVEPLDTPADETLTRAVAFNGRLVAVGRRGAQDLGAAP